MAATPGVAHPPESTLAAVLHTDPGCPWAYSANPDLAVLRWRYGEQLRWRIVVIGLSEDPASYEQRGYTPVRMAQGHLHFRRFGMPFGTAPRARVAATGRACRAIVAVRLAQPELEWAALRALQFGWFCSPAVLDEDPAIEAALSRVDGLDAPAAVQAIGAAEVEAAYRRDREEARSAAGSPTQAQGKTREDPAGERYTAPSVVFADANGGRLEAGGFQSIEAYDVCIANLAPALARTPPPSDPIEALAMFPAGLTTQEVAAVMAPPLTEPHRPAAESRLLELTAEGRVRREPVGDDALWRAA